MLNLDFSICFISVSARIGSHFSLKIPGQTCTFGVFIPARVCLLSFLKSIEAILPGQVRFKVKNQNNLQRELVLSWACTVNPRI